MKFAIFATFLIFIAVIFICLMLTGCLNIIQKFAGDGATGNTQSAEIDIFNSHHQHHKKIDSDDDYDDDDED